MTKRMLLPAILAIMAADAASALADSPLRGRALLEARRSEHLDAVAIMHSQRARARKLRADLHALAASRASLTRELAELETELALLREEEAALAKHERAAEQELNTARSARRDRRKRLGALEAEISELKRMLSAAAGAPES